MSKTLAKIEEAGITTMIIAPHWTATPRWDRLVGMAVGELVELGRSRNTCTVKAGRGLPRLGTLVATVVQDGGAGNPFSDITETPTSMSAQALRECANFDLLAKTTIFQGSPSRLIIIIIIIANN